MIIINAMIFSSNLFNIIKMAVVDKVLLPMFTNKEAYSFYKFFKRFSKTKLVILIQQLIRTRLVEA